MYLSALTTQRPPVFYEPRWGQETLSVACAQALRVALRLARIGHAPATTATATATPINANPTMIVFRIEDSLCGRPKLGFEWAA